MRRLHIALAAAVLAAALAGGLWSLARTEALRDAVRARVVASAQQALGREVQVDAVGGDPLRGIVLVGVRIGPPPGGAGGPLFAAPRVTVHVDLSRLLRDLAGGRGVGPSITRIVLERPLLFVARDAGGRWSYADLLSRQRDPSGVAAFRGQVEVVEGSLVFSDALRLPRRAGPRPVSPFTAHFDRISGRLDFRSSPEVRLAFDLINTDGPTPATVRVAGTAALGRATFDLDLAARGGAVAFWGPYIVPLPWLEWTGGTFDSAVHLLASPWQGSVTLDYRGTLRLRDGQALLLPQQTTLSDIAGPLVVDNLEVATPGLTLALDTSPLWVRGRISHHAGVYVDLALRSKSLDLRTLQAVLFPRARLRLEGRAAGEARLVGPLGSPRLDAEIEDAQGHLHGQAFSAASARLSYYGGVLAFDDLTASAGGGQVAGWGRVDLLRDRAVIFAAAQAVDLASLARAGLPLNATLGGRASGTLLAARGPHGLLAQTRFTVGPGRAAGIAFDRLDVIAGAAGSRVEIDRLEARSGEARLQAFGAVERSGAISVEVAALDVDLQAVADRFGLGRRLHGTADIQGRVAGTVRDPVVEATLRARGGALGPLPFDTARGPVRLTRAGLATPRLVLRDGPATYEASGSLRWAGAGLLDLTLRAHDLPAARLAEIAQLPVDLDGTVAAAVEISGPLGDPAAQGTLELVNGRIHGQAVNRADAAFRWADGALTLEGLTARTNASVLTARGTVSRARLLALSFAATGLDLSDVAAIRTEALTVTGHVDLAGALSGSLRAPLVTAQVASDDLTLNGQPFTRAEGAVRYRRGQLQLAPLTLRQEGGAFVLSGTLGLGPDPTADLRLAAEGGELATLLGMARARSPIDLRGRLDGTLTVAGRLDNPRAVLDLRVRDGRVGDQAVGEAVVAADLAEQAITLRTLRIKPERGELVGAGRIDLRGPSEVEIGGTGLDLDLLRPLFSLRRPLRGTFDVTLQLTGTRDDPVLGLAFSASAGAVGATGFDQLAVQAFYRSGQLHIEHGLLQQDRHRVRLAGALPVDPTRLRLDAARALDLRLDLVDADLSILGLLSERVERGAGPLSGEMTLTGTPARPHFAGTLTTSGGRITLRGIAPALEEVTGQITVSEEVIRVDRLAARMGAGEVTASGTAVLRNFRIDRLALELRADGARLEIDPFYAGFVDAALRLGGTATRPEVAGSATFSQGDLVVSSLTRIGNGTGGGLDPALDVTMEAGEGLWVNVGGLRLQVDGALHAGGTWRRPRLAGEIRAERGTFTAFNNTFVLTEGRATFTEFRGATPYVDARAETRDRVRIVLPSAVAGLPPRVESARVFLHITGTPDALNLALSSDPPFAREEIVAGLARQVGVTRLLAGEATLENVLRAELSSALFGSVGRAVARSLGLEEFAIEYDFVHPLTLRIGRLLIKSLYLTLTSEFSIPRRTIWALEYRISPSTMFSFTIDNFGVTEFLYRITYRF